MFSPWREPFRMPPFPTTAHRMHLESGFPEAAYSLELSEPFRRLRVELMAVGAGQGRAPWGRVLSHGAGLSRDCFWRHLPEA